MTGSNFASYIRRRTGTNSSTLPDADIVLTANVIKDELAGMIASNVDENYFDLEMDRDLEADTRDYTWANDVLKNARYVSAMLDGTTVSYLTETDFSNMEGEKKPLLDNEHIKGYYSDKAPQFLITGRSMKILSGSDIIAVTAGLKIVAEVYPEDIDASDLAAATELSIPSSNITHAMPRAAHRVWAKMVAIEYKQSREKPIPLTEDEKKIEIDLENLYVVLRKRNAVRSFTAGVPNDDGQNY